MHRIQAIEHNRTNGPYIIRIDTEGARRVKDYDEVLRANVSAYRGPYHDIITLAPDLFRLMCRLLDDKRLPPRLKPLVNAAIAYFVVPFDPIPEDIYGSEGYLDDVWLCCHIARRIASEMKSMDILVQNWQGEQDIEKVLVTVLSLEHPTLEEKKPLILKYVGLTS